MTNEKTEVKNLVTWSLFQLGWFAKNWQFFAVDFRFIIHFLHLIFQFTIENEAAIRTGTGFEENVRK